MADRERERKVIREPAPEREVVREPVREREVVREPAPRERDIVYTDRGPGSSVVWAIVAIVVVLILGYVLISAVGGTG